MLGILCFFLSCITLTLRAGSPVHIFRGIAELLIQRFPAEAESSAGRDVAPTWQMVSGVCMHACIYVHTCTDLCAVYVYVYQYLFFVDFQICLYQFLYLYPYLYLYIYRYRYRTDTYIHICIYIYIYIYV